MAAITICSDFGAQKNKVWHCFHCFPIYLPWSDGTGCHDLSFWMLNFKPTFSLSSFTFIKRLFSSSSLSAIRVMSSAYLRLLIFLPPIQGTQVQSLVWEDSTCVEQLSPCAATTEPECCHYWSSLDLCSATRETIVTRSPCTATKSNLAHRN